MNEATKIAFHPSRNWASDNSMPIEARSPLAALGL
jgi:hypothetical protein